MSAVSFGQHVANSFKIPSTKIEKLGYCAISAASVITGSTLGAPVSISILTFKVGLIVGAFAALIAIVAYKILLSYKIENDYQEGMNLSKSEKEKALSLFEKAANRGHREAQYMVGIGYLRELDSLQLDEVKAIDYLEKAANQGHVRALIELGEYHSQRAYDYKENPLPGRNEKTEHDQAIKYFQKAADKDDLEALYNLGWEYSTRDEDGDSVLAITCFQNAADQGYIEAQNCLAECYEFGGRVEQNDQKAFEYYLKIADKDPRNIRKIEHLEFYSSALAYVIKAYEKGRGVAQDFHLANKYRNLLHSVRR